jgi:hypothetical protein
VQGLDDRSDRRLRVVLDVTADGPGPFDRVETGDQVQCHVDAGGHARCGDDVPVVDEARSGVDVRAVAAECLEG